MVHRVQVRPISNDEGNKLLRIVRRSSESVVTWRGAISISISTSPRTTSTCRTSRCGDA
jgi:hypothetical protein